MEKIKKNQKCVIIALNKENLSTRAIARKIQCCQSTVTKFFKKYLISGKTRRKDTVTRRKTTIKEDNIIKRISSDNRFKTAVDIKSTIQDYHNIKSVETVRRMLRESNLKTRRPAKKPVLNQRMKNARLQWAKKYKNWDKNIGEK